MKKVQGENQEIRLILTCGQLIYEIMAEFNSANAHQTVQCSSNVTKIKNMSSLSLRYSHLRKRKGNVIQCIKCFICPVSGVLYVQQKRECIMSGKTEKLLRLDTSVCTDHTYGKMHFCGDKDIKEIQRNKVNAVQCFLYSSWS